MSKVKAGNNPYGFFNQNPSNGNNPNIQPGFLPGYAINPTTGQAYVKTKNGLQAINDQGAEEIAPEMYVLSAGDAIEATKLGLSAGKVGIHLLGDLAESTLPAVKKGSAALAKKFGFMQTMEDGVEAETLRQRVLSNIAQSKLASGTSYFKIHTHIEEAYDLNINTEADASTFWSGKGNKILAENYAAYMDKTTLEMTPGGQYLESLNLFKAYPYKQAIKPWEILSARFANNASGEVFAFVEGAAPTSVFNRIEHPALLANPNVTKITFSPEYKIMNSLKSRF
jgi:hypothetical protein